MKKRHHQYKTLRVKLYTHYGTPRSEVVKELCNFSRRINDCRTIWTKEELQKRCKSLILSCRCHEKEHPSVTRKIMMRCHTLMAESCEPNNETQRCHVEDLLALCRKSADGYEDNPFAGWSWKLADVLTWRGRIFTNLGMYEMAMRDNREAGLIYIHLEGLLSRYSYNDFTPGTERAKIINAFWHGPGLRQSLLVEMDDAWLTAYMGERTLAVYYADSAIEWNDKCSVCDNRVAEDMELLKSLANNLQHRVTPADRPERPWVSWNIIK